MSKNSKRNRDRRKRDKAKKANRTNQEKIDARKVDERILKKDAWPLIKKKQKEIADKQQYHKDNFGQVREPVSAKIKDHRVVAVHDKIYSSKNWRTFQDFFNDYLKRCIGSEVGAE